MSLHRLITHKDLTVLMDEDVLSDIVPSNIVSRQVSIPLSAP